MLGGVTRGAIVSGSLILQKQAFEKERVITLIDFDTLI